MNIHFILVLVLCMPCACASNEEKIVGEVISAYYYDINNFNISWKPGLPVGTSYYITSYKEDNKDILDENAPCNEIKFEHNPFLFIIDHKYPNITIFLSLENGQKQRFELSAPYKNIKLFITSNSKNCNNPCYEPELVLSNDILRFKTRTNFIKCISLYNNHINEADITNYKPMAYFQRKTNNYYIFDTSNLQGGLYTICVYESLFEDKRTFYPTITIYHISI